MENVTEVPPRRLEHANPHADRSDDDRGRDDLCDVDHEPPGHALDSVMLYSRPPFGTPHVSISRPTNGLPANSGWHEKVT